MTLPGARPVSAARGKKISAKGWQQEGALRMLQNNLDPEVAERQMISLSTEGPVRQLEIGSPMTHSCER